MQITATRLIAGALVLGAAAPSVSLAKSAPPAMACTPAALHAADTLHVVLPFPHGRYFEVKPPTGANVSIAFAFDDKNRAVIAERAFLGMKTIDLKVSEALAFNWTNMRPEKIFTAPGRYRLGVGDDFETDEARVDGECTVTYEP